MSEHGDISHAVLVGTGKPRKYLSRRQFLGLTSVTVAALFGGTGIGLVTGQPVKNEFFIPLLGKDDRIAADLLYKDISKGEFSREKVGEIKTVDEMKVKIEGDLKQLKGINEARVQIVDIRNGAGMVSTGEVWPTFVPGSLIKTPVAFEIDKMSKHDHNNYMSDESALQMLRNSSNEALIAQVKLLPIGKDQDPAQTIRKILTIAGIPPQNRDLPLRIKLTDLTKYMAKITEYPPQLAEFSELRREENSRNYGVSDVVHNILDPVKGSPTPYFKIGLIEAAPAEGMVGDDLYNSYLFKIGSLTVVGYARGQNKYNVHKHMLQVAATIASYTANQIKPV